MKNGASSQGISVEEFRKQAMSRVPLGEMVSPDEVADLVAFPRVGCRKEHHRAGDQYLRWIDAGVRPELRNYEEESAYLRNSRLRILVNALPTFFPSLPA